MMREMTSMSLKNGKKNDIKKRKKQRKEKDRERERNRDDPINVDSERAGDLHLSLCNTIVVRFNR